MGIRGLEGFFKRIGCFPHVNIKDLVDKFRDKNPGKDVVAVVDGQNFLNFMALTYDYFFCGGQFKQYEHHLDKYVQMLQGLGIKPVFFFDGTWTGEEINWINARKKDFPKVMDIYEMLPTSANNNVEFVMPVGIYYCALFYLKQKGIEVHICKERSDSEMANYAKRNKCFAIFTSDTNCTIFPGPSFHLSHSSQHLNIDEFSTALYDLDEFTAKTGLSLSHLPLLACLASNEWINQDLFRGLYVKLLSPRNSWNAFRKDESFYSKNIIRLFPELVNFVKYDLVRSSNVVNSICDAACQEWHTQRSYFQDILGANATEKDLRKAVADQVSLTLVKFEYKGLNFKPPSRHKEENEQKTVINDNFVNNNEALAVTLEERGELLNPISCILRRRNNLLVSPYENPTLPPKRLTYFALGPMRKRMYGILLRNDNDLVNEWSYHKEFKQRNTLPILPDFECPNIKDLWAPHETTLVDEKARWKLFVWALDGTPSAEHVLEPALKKLPDYCIAPVAALYVMHKSKLLDGFGFTAREIIQLFLKTFSFSNALTTKQLNGTRLNAINPSALHLAAVFMSTCTQILILNDIVGKLFFRDQLSPAKYFAGTIFQKLYNRDSDLPELDHSAILNMNHVDKIVSELLENE